MKPQESNPLLRVSILGYDARTIRVTGGVAWTKMADNIDRWKSYFVRYVAPASWR